MKKKQLFRGTLLAMASLFLMGCPSDSGGDAKDDVVVSSEQIMVSPTTLDFSSAAGVQEHVTVTANCKWMITNIPNWLIVNPKEGSGNATVTMETAAPNTGNERAVQLKISGLERNVTMTVRQRGEGGSGGETGSRPVIVSFSVSNPTPTGFSMSLTFASNPEATEYGVCFSHTNTMPTTNDIRSVVNTPSTGMNFTGNVTRDDFVAGATYYIRGYAKNIYGTTYSSNVLTVVIPTQTQHSLTVDKTTLTFAAEAGQQTLTVTSTDAWTATSSQPTWCSVYPAGGSSNDHTLVVSVGANTDNTTRTATITLKNGFSPDKVITVTQAASGGSVPVITAFSVYEPTSSSFKFSMTFTSNPASTDYGVCYSSTNTMPTKANSYCTYWSTSSTGKTLNGTVDHNVLVAGTKYYVRAYVVNSYGTTYSSNVLTVTLQSSSPNAPGSGDNPVPNVPARGMK